MWLAGGGLERASFGVKLGVAGRAGAVQIRSNYGYSVRGNGYSEVPRDLVITDVIIIMIRTLLL